MANHNKADGNNDAQKRCISWVISKDLSVRTVANIREKY